MQTTVLTTHRIMQKAQHRPSNLLLPQQLCPTPRPSTASTQRPALATTQLQKRVTRRFTVQASAAQSTQRYIAGSVDVTTILGAVQQWPLPYQAAAFVGYYVALTFATYTAVTNLIPALAASKPGLFAKLLSIRPALPVFFALVGVAHFTALDALRTIYPKQGAWGLWWLPGSDTFHVQWTGVAEVLGGLGVVLGALPALRESFPWLQPLSALALFLLTLAVTPANIYMLTHNAPGPLALGKTGGVYIAPLPLAVHALRFCIQAWFLSMFWGIYTGF